MKFIKLTNSTLRCYVDDKDYEQYGHLTWRICRGYAMRNKPKVNGRTVGFIFLHRLILNIHDPKVNIDHANRNSLDNRRSNLRIANKSENGRNRGIQKNNTTGFKGVKTFRKYFRNKPYCARIQIYGKTIHGPWRNTAREAAIDYNKLAVEHHGEFACLNRL